MQMLSTLIFRLIALLTLLASPALAADAEWDPRIARGTLDNGLSYFIKDSGKAGDPFNINLIVHAGSVDEDRQGGVAHILEHMAFRTNRNHPEGIHRYIDALGWRQGVQINAVTRERETQFMIRTQPDDALDLEGSLSLLRDLVFEAELKASDWENERAVILEELQGGDNVAERISRQKKDVLRAGSRYVGRPTIGTRTSIEQTTIEQIRDFHRKFYTASNMTLVVSGRVSATQAESFIRDLFGSAPAVPAPDRSYLDFPLKSGIHVGVAQDKAGTSSRTIYAFRMAMPDRRSAEGQAAYLDKHFLDRLIRASIRKYGPLYQPAVENLGLAFQETTDHRLILAFSATSPDHDKALKALVEIIERVKTDGLSQAEFADVMTAARRTNARNIDAAARRSYADWGDRIVSAVLTGSVLDDPKVRSERTEALLDRITMPKLVERLQAMLSSPDQVVLYQVPGNVAFTAPDAARVATMRAKWLADMKPAPALYASDMTDRADQTPQPVAPPEWPANAVVPKSGTLVSEHVTNDPHVTEWTLSNGDRVVWLARATPDHKVYISARSQSGFMNAAFGSTLSQAAVQLWTQSGFRFWSQEEYDRWDKARSASLNWSFALKADGLDVAAALAARDIPGMLEDYARRLAFGTIRPEAVDALREQSLEIAETGDDYERLVYGNRLEDTGEEMRAVTVEELEDAAKTLFAAPVTWFAVGPAPDPTVRDAFSSIAGAIPRGQALTSTLRLQVEGSNAVRIGAPVNNRSTVKMSFFSPMNWTPEAGFLLSTLNPLAQKALKDELRYKLGGIYTLRFELELDPASDRAIATLSFECRADRADELVAAARKVLGELPHIAQRADMERIRSDILFAERMRHQDPNTWRRRLALSYRRYGDDGYLRRAAQLPDRLSGDLLQTYAANIFDGKNTAVLISDR